jgi:hypothetical protein
MMPGGKIMCVMTWRVMTECVRSRRVIVVMPLSVILGYARRIGIT